MDYIVVKQTTQPKKSAILCLHNFWCRHLNFCAHLRLLFTEMQFSFVCSSAALNYKLLTILGLDEEEKLHGVYLNGKAFLSCEHNGEGDCNVETPETWYQARDQPNTITAIEVPIIPETGLYTTDLPRSPLIRRDSKGRYWGGNQSSKLLQALKKRHFPVGPFFYFTFFSDLDLTKGVQRRNQFFKSSRSH